MTTLLDLVPNLKKVANTHGGEYAGPCPLCGGKDRFHAQPAFTWQDGDTGAWFCRQCSPHWDDTPALVMRLHNCTYPEALRFLGVSHSTLNTPHPTLHAPPSPQPPPAPWQARAWEFVQAAADHLMSDQGAKARAWLHHRGFTDATLADAMLGYHPGLYVSVRGHGDGYFDSHANPTAWGLPDDAKKIWLPRGIVIPWLVDGNLWNVEIRRPLTQAEIAQGQAKYHSIKGGSKQAMLGADRLDRQRPAILVEGALDRLAILQAAPDLVNVVAAGSTTGARQSTWLLRLASQPQVLVAFDADDPGEEAATWWLQVLGDRAIRWRPDYADPAAMLQSGADQRAWLQTGLDHADHNRLQNLTRQAQNDLIDAAFASPSSPSSPSSSSSLPSLAPSPQPLSPLPDHCATCGADVTRYTASGRPACDAHYDTLQAEDLWNALGDFPRSSPPSSQASPLWDPATIAPHLAIPEGKAKRPADEPGDPTSDVLPPMAGRESKHMWDRLPPTRPIRQVLQDLGVTPSNPALMMRAAVLDEHALPGQPTLVPACPTCGQTDWRIGDRECVCNICYPETSDLECAA